LKRAADESADRDAGRRPSDNRREGNPDRLERVLTFLATGSDN